MPSPSHSSVSILGQPNSVHIPTSHLLEIHPNIIHPSAPRSPQWSPSFRFPHQDPIHPPLLTHTRHMPSQSHSSVSILGNPNSVHITTSHLLEIRPNIIHPSTPRSPQWCLSLQFPHQDPIYPLSSPIRATCAFIKTINGCKWDPIKIGSFYTICTSVLCFFKINIGLTIASEAEISKKANNRITKCYKVVSFGVHIQLTFR